MKRILKVFIFIISIIISFNLVFGETYNWTLINNDVKLTPKKLEAISAGGSHSLAIKPDGTLLSWGYNSSGQLGLGDKKNRNTPTKVGKSKNWKAIAAGTNHSLALKSDGTLWAWGDNGSGKLGLGDKKNRNTPTKVGKSKNWKAINAGNFYSLVLKSDGTLYFMGISSDSSSQF